MLPIIAEVQREGSSTLRGDSRQTEYHSVLVDTTGFLLIVCNEEDVSRRTNPEPP